MQTPSSVYLKGYYGRQNLGDEILLFGVMQYLHQERGVEEIMIECDTKLERMTKRMDTHKELIEGINYNLVARPNQSQQIKIARSSLRGKFPYLVLGGGEVINTIHKFPHNGRNYLMLYRGNIMRHHYTILGGVTIRRSQDMIAKHLIKNANEVVVRDSGSYENASNFRDDVVAYQDFAVQVIDHYKDDLPIQKNNSYILINLHPSKLSKENIDRIKDFVANHKGKQAIFVPCDMTHDSSCYEPLKKEIPDLLRYDWTQHDIPTILKFFAEAEAGIGARLHFLLLLKELGVDFEAIVYHEKVKKVLGIAE